MNSMLANDTKMFTVPSKHSQDGGLHGTLWVLSH